jgi:phosphoglycerate dehydrogenase-like enzyme
MQTFSMEECSRELAAHRTAMGGYVQMVQLKGLFLLNASARDEIYGAQERAAIAELLDLYVPPQTAATVAEWPDLLGPADVILSGWGMPVVDAAFLAHTPRLQAIFYGAGSVRGFVTDALWARGIRVTSAQSANAEAVADYTLAAIVFALKHGWQLAAQTRREQCFPSREGIPGVYGATVGIISLGMIGRLVRERLRPFGVRVLAYDPFVTAAEAERLHVSSCSLPALFAESDVVSLHAPLLPETRGLIGGELLAALPQGATLINTARGALIREQELVDVLERRSDLHAVLDVTWPEPPPPGSPLYILPNVTLTPHIGGAVGRERRRLGALMVDELRRFVAGEPLRHEVTREQLERMATP